MKDFVMIKIILLINWPKWPEQNFRMAKRFGVICDTMIISITVLSKNCIILPYKKIDFFCILCVVGHEFVESFE